MKPEYESTYIQNRSYWEVHVWPMCSHYLIIGAGFTGLYTALFLKENHPDARIVVIDSANRYGGASTRNAGFICFGSPTEILADLKAMGREKTTELIKQRMEGVEYLKKYYPSDVIDISWDGGTELFLNQSGSVSEEDLDLVNDIIDDAVGEKDAFTMVDASEKGLYAGNQVAVTKLEGALNPAKAIAHLNEECRTRGIEVINGCQAYDFSTTDTGVKVETSLGVFHADKMALCTNAFTRELLPEESVIPAKNQVYMTTPVTHDLRGTYHLHEGFVYFRPVMDRILIGGARHLDDLQHDVGFNTEVEVYLKSIVREYICPDQSFDFQYQWLGHIGIGQSKEVIVRKIDSRTVLGVRLSGMGVALAPSIARRIATLLID